MTSFQVVADAEAVCRVTAERFVEVAVAAIEARGIFRVAMSGGSTPQQVYPLLLEPARRDTIDWAAVEFFWVDERTVPPDHPDSNFGVAYGQFISQLPHVRPERVHRMPAEVDDLEAAARSYESEMRLAFANAGDEPPAFDLVWLGMGPDGHTASLFPGSPALDESERWVVPAWSPALQVWRMTLTFPVLNAGRNVLVGIFGSNKADALRSIRAGESDLPAARVVGDQVEWIVDAAAADEAEAG